MKVNYDKEADAVYFELKKGKFSKNKKIDRSTIVDLDANNQILGIEFLDASKRGIHKLTNLNSKMTISE